MIYSGYVIFHHRRLSLAKMNSIKEGMSGDRKVQWKATCGYSFSDGQSTSDDVVRGSFDTLNLFEFRTPGKFEILARVSQPRFHVEIQ